MPKNTIKNENERNNGIDFLKIISMFFVVLLHSLGEGGLLYAVVPGTSQYKITWFLEIIAYCAVDIFVLVTGYVSYREKERKVKISKYLQLWLQVVFYGLVISICFQLFIPEMVGKRTYLNSVLPVLTDKYWYFTSYTGLFIFMPLLDTALRKINTKDLKKLFILIVFIFSIYPIVDDGLALQGGYSVMWFLILYFLGGIIKKCHLFEKVKSYFLVSAIICFYLVSFICQIYNFHFTVADINIMSIFSVGYVSPMVLGTAISYLLLFSRIRFNSFFKKIIAFFAPTTFAIYLLNSNPLINSRFILYRFAYLVNSSVFSIIYSVLSFTIIFVLISMLLDKLRIILFQKLRVKEILEKLDLFFDKISDKLISLI